MEENIIDLQRDKEKIEHQTKAIFVASPLVSLIQMRKANEERAVCFELNVRFSGTTPMRDHFRYRDVIAMIKEYCLEESIQECFQIRKGMACRYINEFYLDRNPMEQLQEQDKVLDMDSFAFAEQHVERSGKR